MGRTKKTTLFNKNHITIIKIENDIPAILSSIETSFSTKKNNQGNWKVSDRTTKTEKWVEYYLENTCSSSYIVKEKPITKTERVKSPLGFYYTRTITEYPSKKSSDSKSVINWTFHTDNGTSYILTYYTQVNGTKVSQDTRPWELLDNEYFEDNYINVLINLLNKIIDESKSKYSHSDFNNKYVSSKPGTFDLYNRSNKSIIYIGNLTDVKNRIFTELFGYPDGPKRQTNNEKILSHGFDLKTSFRKM